MELPEEFVQPPVRTLKEREPYDWGTPERKDIMQNPQRIAITSWNDLFEKKAVIRTSLYEAGTVTEQIWSNPVIVLHDRFAFPSVF